VKSHILQWLRANIKPFFYEANTELTGHNEMRIEIETKKKIIEIRNSVNFTKFNEFSLIILSKRLALICLNLMGISLRKKIGEFR